MDKKRVEQDIAAVIFSLFFFLLMYFFVNPSIIGLVIYEPGYSYNTSEINVSNGTISIKSIQNATTIVTNYVYEHSLTAANYDGDDELSRVASLDNSSKNIDKDEIFDITFNGSLDNGDKINIVVDDVTGNSVEVYLCDASTICSYPGYGSVNVSSAGIYRITISGLNSTKNSFNLDPPKKVNINYINATRFVNVTNTTISYYYPIYPIEVVTEDIEPANLSSFDNFLRNDSLNGQSISYKYSIDSGTNWVDLPNDNLSGINSSKIKIKAILQSNGSETPYIYSLSINYSIVIPQNYTEDNSTNNSTNSTNSSTTNSTSNNTNSTQNNTASNSTNSTSNSTESNSGSGGTTSSASSGEKGKGGISSAERAARSSSTISAPSPSAPASAPVSTPARATAPPTTGRVSAPPTAQAIKIEESKVTQNRIVAITIISAILILILIVLYIERKALKGKIMKKIYGVRIRAG